jgi:intracellular septation protein A
MAATFNSPTAVARHGLSGKVHGFIDYLCAIVLFASPKLFHFTDQNIAPMAAMVLGAVILLYSLVTDYELGVIRMMPFSGHLLCDFVAGLALLGSPWHFHIDGNAAVVFVVIGVIQFASVFITRRPRNVTTS